MKTILIGILITIIGFCVYKTIREIAYNSFQEGVVRASQGILNCPKDDNSKDYFPKYFHACESLCKTLYKEKAICVSSISGGSITCVCEQTENN